MKPADGNDYKELFINYVEKKGGGGVRQMSTILNKLI